VRSCIWRIRSGVKGFAYGGSRTTFGDASDLADAVADGPAAGGMDRTAAGRELREAVRHRAKLVALRSGLEAQVTRAAKQGVHVPMSDLFGVAGAQLLAGCAWMRRSMRGSSRCVVDRGTGFRDRTSSRSEQRGVGCPSGLTARSRPSTGSVRSRGDLRRRDRRRHSLSPSGAVVLVGGVGRHCTGSRIEGAPRSDHQAGQHVVAVGGGSRPFPSARWAPRGGPIPDRGRRGANISKVAVARKLLTLVFTVRDGHIRCLARRRRKVRTQPG